MLRKPGHVLKSYFSTRGAGGICFGSPETLYYYGYIRLHVLNNALYIATVLTDNNVLFLDIPLYPVFSLLSPQHKKPHIFRIRV